MFLFPFKFLPVRYLSIISLFTIPLIQSAAAQDYNPAIDIQHYTFSLRLNDENNLIRGEAAVTLRYLTSTSSFSLDLVKKGNTGKGMSVSRVTEKGHHLRFEQDKETLRIWDSTSHKGDTHTYLISYEGIPADGLIISTNQFGHRTFFGDNWPNRAHNWLPCVDHPSDKATVDFIVTAPDHYQVVSNGRKEADSLLPDHYRLTHWKETAPLPTKVMVIGVAAFAIDHPGDIEGLPVYSYVFPENKQRGFQDYSIATRILSWVIHKVGPYAYEKLANVQSKTIFGGMENASTIFYFEGSVGDEEIEPLMAHEIAHQWFGDAVTETGWQHLWLSEGFATFMENCYMEAQHGPDTLKSLLIKDRKKVISFEKKRFTPIVDTTVTGNYMQLLNANSYQKGGWVLHMLRRQLGDSLFWKGIAAYYAQYKNGNANTAALEKCMETASGQDLQLFFRQWLYSAGHPSLHLSWNYDADKKVFNLAVEQKQDTLFSFPLEYSVDGVLYKADIKDRLTNISLPLPTRPSIVTPDPNVNLLADFN
jgi:aminopeptidase N